MTRKNAKKVRARARQDKTGQSYQSALRAEGPTIIKLKNDDKVPPEYEALAIFNGGNSAIIEDDHCLMVVNRHYDNNQTSRETRRTDLFSPTPWLTDEAVQHLTGLARKRAMPPLRGWGLDGPPGGFTPKTPLEGFKIEGGFNHDLALADLKLPEDVLKNRHLYERFYYGDQTVKHTEPQLLMDYWKGLPEARRITDSKQRLLGVTDDHPEKPLITWVTLTSTKGCKGFAEWWRALPESKTYDRAV